MKEMKKYVVIKGRLLLNRKEYDGRSDAKYYNEGELPEKYKTGAEASKKKAAKKKASKKKAAIKQS